MEFEVETISVIAGEGLKTLGGMLPVQKIGVRRLGRIDVWVLLAGFAEEEQFGGSGRSSAEKTTEKMAVLAPMPRASVKTTTRVKPGLLRRNRTA
jgi:hypothetical protein